MSTDFGVHREVDQRPPLELEDRLARVAVLLVLPARLFHRLARERVLQLQRGDRDAVQAQRDIERLLRAWREVQLPGQPQAVRGVACLQLRVQLVRRLEEGRVQRPPIALEAVAQRCERRRWRPSTCTGRRGSARRSSSPCSASSLAHSFGWVSRMKASTGLGKDRPLAVEAVPVDGVRSRWRGGGLR